MQFGPFAVAQLRVLAEMRALTKATAKAPPPEPNLFITDTLGNPFAEVEQLPRSSRRSRNRGARPTSQARTADHRRDRQSALQGKGQGRGGWIEKGAGGKLHAPLDRWKAPAGWGVGAHGKHLRNLYVYFWRWATLKVFGLAASPRPACRIRTKPASSASSPSPAFSTGRASRRCAMICAGRARTSG